MTQYPHDEFDDVPERTQREGAHRTFLSVRNPRVGLWVLVVLGIVVLIIGIIMFTVVRPGLNSDDDDDDAPLGDDLSSSAPATSGAASSDAAGSAGPSPTPAPTQSASESSEPEESEAPSESASESSSPSQEVDHSASVGVYNATTQNGLAAQKVQTLQGTGFTSVTDGNWTKPATESVVYYKSDDQEATAKAVASALGISSTYQIENIPSEITVVIGR